MGRAVDKSVDSDIRKIERCGPRAREMPRSVMCLPCRYGDLSLDSQHSHKKPGAGGHEAGLLPQNSRKLSVEAAPGSKFQGGIGKQEQRFNQMT